MKKPTYKVILLLMTLLLNACIWNTVDDDIIEPGFQQPQQYEAVTMLISEFENSTALLPAEPITETGKIYVKDGFLFINRPNKGFHVFDNSNPSAPVNLAFLKVLGSSDLSIKNEVLYINNATDLIAVKPNFANNTIEITKRISNTFPELAPPNNCCYHNTPANEIIINWILTE
ncbi:hypothetical protein [Lacinutrix sp. Bg11-31]|uniref:hypothetical protein n=1 Tax=Lacinutrix sp. Bg11-31 TaxID=2057808 RepID=UPI000C314E8F|nr:hypothetical protein [Lacinutrix sp. Bg11-31]AUC81944.1 hypothetical protein CW733_07295 [Lacinutrix sp. Bg11-31]